MEAMRCKESFFAASKDGHDRLVEAGQIVAGDDPVLRGRDLYFEPIDVAVDRALGGTKAAKAAKAPKALKVKR